MTTKTDSSSPFTGSAGAGQETPEVSEEFSIRTMQDDLAALQKKGGQPMITPEIQPQPNVFENSVPEPTKKQAEPAPVQTPIQEPTREPSPTDQYPVEKIPAPKMETYGEEPIFIRPEIEMKPIRTRGRNIAYKLTLTVLIVLILTVLGLGGYYFWLTRAPKQEPQQQPSETPQQTQQTGTPTAVVPSAEKYSPDKPNYLQLDLATLFPEDIRKSITDIANELGSKAAEKPYEFVIVDTTNTPVSFSVFAAAAKLNLSATALESLGDNFSLFIYSDGATRLALSVDGAQKETLSAALAQQEKTLVTDAGFLFLGTKPPVTVAAFKNSSYGNAAIRYVNLMAQPPLSIDYTIIDNHFIIATSRKTMHAVLDKITAAKSAAALAEPTAQQTASQTPVAD